MKSFLVTGALGFIGSNFVNYFAKLHTDFHFVILDKKDYCASLDNIDSNFKNIHIVIGDIQNHELVYYLLTQFQVDCIIHFAAETHVDNSFFNSISFTKNNVLGTHILLEVARTYQKETQRLQKFIHVSTDEVYGEVKDNEAKHEKSVLHPTNPYAASKAAAEFMAMSYHISYQLPIVITRGNNVYGPNQYPEKVIPRFIMQMVKNEKLTIQGNGSSLRNFIHVDDVSRAFEIILEKGQIGEIYNISSAPENEYSVLQVAEKIISMFHPGQNWKDYISYVEDRHFNDARYFISSEKLEKLGWKPQFVDFDLNLKMLKNWYQKNKTLYFNK